jgi:hypothetical protein
MSYVIDNAVLRQRADTERFTRNSNGGKDIDSGGKIGYPMMRDKTVIPARAGPIAAARLPGDRPRAYMESSARPSYVS